MIILKATPIGSWLGPMQTQWEKTGATDSAIPTKPHITVVSAVLCRKRRDEFEEKSRGIKY